MPPKSVTQPQKAVPRKRARKDSAGTGNQTLDGYVIKKPRTPKENETSNSPNQPSDNPEELLGGHQDKSEDEDEEAAYLPRGRSGKNQLDQTQRPISDIDAAFWDMAVKSAELLDEKNGHLVLRVATMCSGTEAPILGLRVFQEFFERIQPGRQFLQFLHVFSAEIVGFKQSYIMRNTDDTVVFNNVQDFINPLGGKAPTAMGSLVTIPGDIDILISGCSCVDFSTLNTNKKTNYSPTQLRTEHSQILTLLKENGYDDTEYERVNAFFIKCLEATPGMGSSSKTFFSMLSYIRDYRPKVVILENVLGAPWNETANIWFPFLGYTAYHTKLDTKDFYIPQTRNRGYLIALDNSIFAKGKTYPKKEPKKEDAQKKGKGKGTKKTKEKNEAEKRAREEEELKWDAGKIGRMWIHLLKNVLPRRASSPVLMWLLPPAHPLTERARQDDSEKTLGFAKETDWQRSKIIHIRTRRKEELGNSRDLTQWGIKGGQPYDRLDRNVVNCIPDRVKDCMEIGILRALLKGYQIMGIFYVYDSRFKNRISDLSQNIHRSDFGSPFGITGCLTPGGIHYMSDQCRMVSGYETLVLQGLPLHRIEFATETQEQLRDLAGNAMSTTVIGAVLLALFRAVCSQPEGPQKYFNRPLLLENKKRPRLTAKPKLKDLPGFSTMDAQPLKTSTIRELYARSRRYCFCNGAAKYSTDDFLKCKLCLTVRCKWCAGNPEHSFEQTARPADYILLSEVEQEVMRFFPGTIMSITTSNWLTAATNSSTGVTIADVKDALQKLRNVTFYYESVRVTEVVTVCYSGQWGFDVRAKLSDVGITWYLYLDPWSEVGNALEDTLKHVDPELAKEYVRSPQPIAKAEVFENSASVLPESHAWKLWHFIKIQMDVSVLRQEKDLLKITNIHVRYPDDAQHQLDLVEACGSYSHFTTCDGPEQSLHGQDKKVFLFKDVSRILTPDLDGYVISKSCRQLEYHEYREVLMKFDTRVNMSKQQTGIVKAHVDGYWKTPRFDGVYHFAGQKFGIFNRMEKLKVFGSRHSIIEDEEPEQLVLAEAQIVRETECDPYKTIVKYKAQCEEASDGWATVTKADLHHLHGFISHVNVKLAGIEDLEISFELKDIETWLKNYKDWKDGIFTANPRECPYGQLPPIRWIKVGTKHIGHHLTDAMADFEKRFKTRIPIFEPRVRVLPSPDVNGEMHAILVQYLFQHKVLGQKAAVFLPPTRDPKAKVTAGVQIERNAVLSQNMQVNSNGGGRHTFEPFRNALRSLEGFPCATEPALETFQGQLSESQLRSLAWILARERGDPKFVEQEVEEEIVPELKLRLVGWAKRIVTNHGGVLADDVGYGKTVIMLALAHCQQEFDERQSSQQTHCNYLKATLAVVPGHLISQWIQEALRFLPVEPEEIVGIQSISDLQDDASLSVLRRLQKARIVVVTKDLFEPRYSQRLARLAGSLDPPDPFLPLKNGESVSSRSFRDWYEDAAPAARAHVSALFSTPEPDIQKVWDDMNRRIERLSNEYKLYAEDLSRRTGEGRGMEGNDEEDEVIETNVQTSQRITSWQELEREMHEGKFLHVLDEFTFARVVYDEFSYDNIPAMTFFANCSAHAKWILSATPLTSNLDKVNGIANLVNIHIARPIHSRVGMPRITVGPTFVEQTNAESLQNRKLMSDLCIRKRHEKGIEFLKTFATSNPLDLVLAGGIVVEEKVIVSELNKHEAIKYMTLEHDLRACGLDANMLPVGCRAQLRTLIDPQEWTEEGRNVAVRLLLARSSCGSDGQSLESLLQERRDQAQRAIVIFRVHLEKAVWLAWRVLTNDGECAHLNATTAVQDILMILRDIWCKDIEICGGLDAWKQLFEALNVGSYEDRFQELVINHPNFRKDDKELLRFLYGLRQSSWNDYYDLKAEHLSKIGEEEAGELLTDLLKAPHNTSAISNKPMESKKDKLAALLGGQGLARFRQQGPSTGRRATSGKMPSSYSKTLKTILANLARSIGIIENDKDTKQELWARLKAHYEGTLDDSEYVGMNDSRAIKRTEFPTFGGAKNVRGGKYTATSSETSDASVGLRAAFDQLDLAIKQKRIVENLVSEEEELRCDNCEQLKPRKDLHIVCECGHVLCKDHLDYTYCGDNSPNGASGCRSLLVDATKSLALIDKPQRSLSHEPSTQDQIPGISSKSQMIANCIKGIPEDDQVILFFQFDCQKEELKETLHKNKITYTESPDQPTDCKVRFLNLNAETSSGTNLQSANHVMFACPLLMGLQEDYDSCMKQAKGRCIRFGQKKVVHVYHFVAAHTFEADMLEVRRQSHILVRPGRAIGRLHHVPQGQAVVPTNPASASQVVNGDATNGEERVRSMLTLDEVWKAMNESNWLNTVGIEY